MEIAKTLYIILPLAGIIVILYLILCINRGKINRKEIEIKQIFDRNIH